MNNTYKIHDFTSGQTQLIDWSVGDYTVHDYGRDSLEVGLIMADGRIWQIKDDKVPSEVWDFIDAKNDPEPYDDDAAMSLYADYVNSLPPDCQVW